MPNVQVSFELTDDENTAFAEYLRLNGYTKTGWIRGQVLTLIKRIKQEESDAADQLPTD